MFIVLPATHPKLLQLRGFKTKCITQLLSLIHVIHTNICCDRHCVTLRPKTLNFLPAHYKNPSEINDKLWAAAPGRQRLHRLMLERACRPYAMDAPHTLRWVELSSVVFLFIFFIYTSSKLHCILVTQPLPERGVGPALNKIGPIPARNMVNC